MPQSGRIADTVKVLERMHDLAKERYVSCYWPAVICSALGRSDEAFNLLETAYRERAVWMAYAKVAPFFDDRSFATTSFIIAARMRLSE